VKITTKLNLLSIGIVVVITIFVLGVGALFINDILDRNLNQVLRLELENAGKAILHGLHRSGVRTAAASAAEMDRQLRQKDGLRSAQLYIIPVHDEIGHLQEGINAMSARIEQRTLERQIAENALKARRSWNVMADASGWSRSQEKERYFDSPCQACDLTSTMIILKLSRGCVWSSRLLKNVASRDWGTPFPCQRARQRRPTSRRIRFTKK